MRDPVGERFEALFGPEFNHGKSFDLTPLRNALEALGSPQAALPPVIHVAGTNGKGSTIAFIRAIAEAAGMKVHAFTKPHLFRINERFVVSSEIADDALLHDVAGDIARVGPNLTQFDAQAAAAFVLFHEHHARLALIETGMGGRDDSTNLVTPAACVIAPIGLDHQDKLGATLAEIAAHKAGILKAGVPAILARQTPETMAVLEARAEAIGAPLFRAGVEWDAYASHGRLVVQTETRALDLPLPALQGRHQIDNAGLACAALLRAEVAIDDPAFAAGVERASWPGRLQPLTRGVLSAPVRASGGEVWVDGGHNAQAAIVLARALNDMRTRRGGGANVAIVGMRSRKAADSFIAALAGGVDRVIAVPLSASHIAPELIAASGETMGMATSIAPSLQAAMQNAAQSPAPRVLICGSFVLAAEALALENA